MPGPATRIDITGAFFSTTVPAYPAQLTPHLVVLVRAAAGTDGNATLETVFVRDSGEEIGRNRQSFVVEPGKFGYRLVKGELEFPGAGNGRGPLHDRRERLGSVGAADRPARRRLEAVPVVA